VLSVLRKSVGAWIDHRGASKGAALAFYALFALAPIAILAIGAAGRLLGPDQAHDGVVAQVEWLAGPGGAQALQAVLGSRVPVYGVAATIFASVLSLAGATAVFVELKASLDEMWGVEPPRGFGIIAFLRTHLHSFGLVLMLALLLLVSLGLSAALAVLEGHAGAIWGESPAALRIVSAAAAPAIIACLFAVIYKGLPDAPLSWRDAWIGAAFTAGMFSLGKYAIALYLGSSTVAASFGAAGSLIALLLWVYYSAQIFFLGAEFTRQFALAHGSLGRRAR
jgi:membrane protein